MHIGAAIGLAAFAAGATLSLSTSPAVAQSVPRPPAAQTVPPPAGDVISAEQAAKNIAAAEARKRLAREKHARAYAALVVENREADPDSITVDMSISVTEANPPEIIGNTNLPDGTKLSVLVHGDRPACLPRCLVGFDFPTVRNGRFTATLKCCSTLPERRALNFSARPRLQ
jgi:hypothetical protein